MPRVKPNDKCSCGSGRKYKKERDDARRKQQETTEARRKARMEARARGERQPEPYGMSTAALMHILSAGMMPPRLR